MPERSLGNRAAQANDRILQAPFSKLGRQRKVGAKTDNDVVSKKRLCLVESVRKERMPVRILGIARHQFLRDTPKLDYTTSDSVGCNRMPSFVYGCTAYLRHVILVAHSNVCLPSEGRAPSEGVLEVCFVVEQGRMRASRVITCSISKVPLRGLQATLFSPYFRPTARR